MSRPDATLGRRRVVTPGGALALAATAGLLILVWASVTGPVALFGSTGPNVGPRPAQPTPSESPSPEPGPQSGEEMFGDLPPRFDFSWIGDLISWTVLLGSLAVVAVALRWMWRTRWRRPPRQPDPDFDVLPSLQTLTEALARDSDARISAIAEGTPRNGIVRCWLRLEEVIADAGLPREPWETSAEFTVRILRSLDIDPRSIGVLADLYREARFSAHALDEQARETAEAALRRLQDELTAARS